MSLVQSLLRKSWDTLLNVNKTKMQSLANTLVVFVRVHILWVLRSGEPHHILAFERLPRMPLSYPTITLSAVANELVEMFQTGVL